MVNTPIPRHKSHMEYVFVTPEYRRRLKKAGLKVKVDDGTSTTIPSFEQDFAIADV